MKIQNNNTVFEKLFIKVVLLLVLNFSVNIGVQSQFYNGHQMTFGKNRVQFQNYYWRYNRYDKFDSYFYLNGADLSRTVAKIAEKKIIEVENFFGHGFQKRLIFLCYRNLSEFRESNVGYDSGNENSNMGGVTKTNKNKIFVYFEGEYEKLEKQITAGITEAIINEMLYGGKYRQKMTNSALINLPEWYISGLISYLSDNWSFEIENKLRDGFKSKKMKKINHLTGEDAKLAGHSFWYFLGETYGIDVIPNILYMTRVNKNSESGFKYVIGRSTKELSPEWKQFYMQKFTEGEDLLDKPEKNSELIKAKKHTFCMQVKTNPKGKYIAYVTNKQGKYKVIIYDKERQKKKTIRKKGHKLEQITDYSYPVTAWHPSGKILSFITEEQGEKYLFTYYTETKELKRRNLQYLEKVLSFNYSHDGFLLVFSGVKGGQSDIYVFNIAAGTFEAVTKDLADDLYPSFSKDSKKIIFTSNRTCDSVRCNKNKMSENHDIFVYDYSRKNPLLQRITKTPYFSEKQAQEIKNNSYMSITDKNGIYNRQVIKHDSTISRVDTTIHYRYYSIDYPITNYSGNIYEFDYNNYDKLVTEVLLFDDRYRIYEKPFYYTDESRNKQKYTTEFREFKTQKYLDKEKKILQEKINEEKRKAELDSLRKNPPKNIIHPDSVLVNVNNYIFEREKQITYYKINPIKDTLFKENKDSLGFIPTRNYLTNFYTNHLVQQIDFGTLNNSYQVFTGGAYYFNPGVNIFTKIGVFDLFEDYRVSGGFRMGTNFNSYEYLLSLENIKSRLDKEYVYHRQTFTQAYQINTYEYVEKVFTNEAMYILKYPFNQIASAKATISLRHDRGVFLSQDFLTLEAKDTHQFFAGLKLEYIFDNTFRLGTNLFDGTRFKVFGEFYQEVDQGYTNLFVTGMDFRFYKKIHRSLIFASRLAGSASFGKSKLIYYLGGVDNWTVFSPDKQMFDYSVETNKDDNYVYQAVATNMRGFIQNARNGTNFFVMNNELRFPVVRYLINRPLNSDFLNNLQIVGFADMGSAWSGLTPNDEKNAYRKETVQNGPVTVVIDKNRWPVVFGYGFGVRSKLFGYFIRLDWAWGIDSDVILPRVFYFSLNLDF